MIRLCALSDEEFWDAMDALEEFGDAPILDRAIKLAKRRAGATK
jgi:hypothetical protein